MKQTLKDKINDAMKEKFVGNFIFSEDELSDIYDNASIILRRIGNEWGIDLSQTDYNLIFVALVNLSKDWNSDEESALFKFFYKKLLGSNENCEGKIYTQITNAIQGLNNSNKIFMLNSYKKKYYATLCGHSFAPLSSVESFFDMCWEIYCKDLDQQYGKNDPAFRLIVQSLHNRFSFSENNEDDFRIGSKVYSFRAGIRGLAIDKPDLMVDLLDVVMNSIHSLFNNEPLLLDKYIKVLINNWWNKKESTFGIDRIRTHRRYEHIITDYSQIKAKYVLEDGIAKLVIPSIRLCNDFDDEPYIKIIVEGKELKYEKMITTGSGILMATKPYEIVLSNLNFNKSIDISIEIIHCDKVIYNSKDILNREFILYKDSKEVLSQDCLPGLYFLYTTNLGELLQYPNDIHRSTLNTYSLDSKESEVIQSNSKTVFFIKEKSNKDLYFFAKEHNDVIFRLDDEEYKVIDGELYVDVAYDIDIKNYGVRYEESSFKLSDFEFEEVNGRKRYQVSILLNVGEPQHITIFKYSDNSIFASINLIKFNNIRISFDKELYYGKDNTGIVKFVTDKYNEEMQFNIDDSDVFIPLSNGELILFPPILKWRIDNNKWNTKEHLKGIWYKDFTNSSILSVELPKTMNCVAALSNNEVIEQCNKSLCFKLGQTIYSLKDNRNNKDSSILLFVRTNNNMVYALSKIFYKESFINEPIYIFPNLNQVLWLPENYIGDSDSIFRFEILDDKGIIYSKELSTKKETITISNIDDGYYKYRLILKGKGFLNKEKELCSKEFVFGDVKKIKYKNKVLIINEAMLFGKINADRVRTIYVDSICYIGNEDGYDYYSGLLFVIDKNRRKIYLKSMKNEQGIYVNVNPLRIEFKNDRAAYIMYGLDTQNGGFGFYDGFYLDNQGKTTICDKVFGENTKGIDYFLFEVKKNV